MNDRLKFRVFIKSEQRLITNVTGFVIDTNKEKIRIFRMNPDMADGMGSELFMLADAIIDQCTGLKDKNGVLIYEGDTVKHNKSAAVGVIEWDEEQTGFVCEVWCGSQFSSGEVVGNIPENGDLLK